ncbi:MAG: hypothetical protein J7578_21880, partial [Chitinophagaceae bacterium]|nr:hypothetical protein [Chitinophagaceae bacterium]
ARYSPYVYSIDDPINYYDTDGEIIRDKKGNIVFIPIEDGVMNHGADKEGAKGTFGFIYTNDGTAIMVFKNKSSKKGFDTDCHGQTFTKGKYWINNSEVRKILKGDGYKKIKKSEIKKGDIVIYTDGKDGVEDSRVVVVIDPTTGEIKVYGQGGLEEENYESGIDEAWESDGQEYYRKTQKDRVVDDQSIAAMKKKIQKMVDDEKKKAASEKKKEQEKKKAEEKKKDEEKKKTNSLNT